MSRQQRELRPAFATLIRGAAGLAEQMLASDGEFLPYVALLDSDGNIAIVDCDEVGDDGTPLLERLARAAGSRARVASAVIYDALVPGDGDARDAIAIELSHCDGERALALMRYTRQFATLLVEPPSLVEASDADWAWIARR